MIGPIHAIVLPALLAAHSVWAVCDSDIDMEGKRIIDVAVYDDDGTTELISEAATQAYVQKAMDERSRGNMLSDATVTKGMTWAEAVEFCATLVSPGNNGTSHLYSDWRLPRLDEWLAGCQAEGSELTLDMEGKTGEWYKENKLHPRREWTPKGTCKKDGGEESLWWWINRHSAETQEGEDLLYHGQSPTGIRDPETTVIDPLHHPYPPESPEIVVRNIAYGYPEAWKPTSSEIQKIRGDEKLSVQCIR